MRGVPQTPPAMVRAERSSAAPHAIVMGNPQRSSPNPSRDGPRRAKLGGPPRDSWPAHDVRCAIVVAFVGYLESPWPRQLRTLVRSSTASTGLVTKSLQP